MTAPTRPAGTAGPPSSAPAAQPQALTFVFTDIEGSTRLLEELRDRYAEVLASHGRLIGEAVARAGGEVVDTQGDSFFLAFRSTAAAVAFATDAQHALAREQWPTDTHLRVRMGIHAGEATPNAGGYVGLDVHRAARVSSAAHGGQVLLSAEAADGLGNGTELKAIGAHQLKDFARPIALHQLLIDGLPADFPPPRVMDEPDQPPAEGEPPYQGLAHFEEDDAPRFFGREQIVERLVARLAEQPFLAVIGASGSGKSSVVRAGLIPALRQQGVSRVVLLTPTAEPFTALAAALAPDGGDSERSELAALLRFGPDALAERLGEGSLLVVDQAEELFSLTRDEAERAAFIERLLSATGAGGYVVLTLRADFYDRLAGYPTLRDAVAAQQEYLGQMSADELRAAIEGPAQAGGWRFDAGLVDLILHDVGTEPGALPLLSHALLETWQRRRGRLMMLRGYLESGGVQAAIARSADRLMAELQPDQQLIARTIFLRLTEFGAGTPDTRRRAGLTELLGQADGDAAGDVLQRLAEHRLVVLGEDTAEVAHEALIREWPTLREWLAADREALRLHRSLTEAATDWQRANREPSLLFRGARLAAALDWAPAHAAELNDLERDFLDESRLASEREAQRQRQVNRRLRFLLAGAGVFLVLAIGAGAYAALEAGRAEREAISALAAQQDAEGSRSDADAARIEAENNAAEAERQEQLALEEARRAEEAARRAEEAAREARAHALYASAIAALEEDPQLAILLALEGRQLGIDPPADNITALHRAVRDARGLVHFELTPPPGPVRPDLLGIELSPDGQTVYVASTSRSVDVYDAESGERLSTLGTPRSDSASYHLGLALWEDSLLAYVDEDAVIHVWNLASGTEQLIQAPGAGTIRRPTFSADGRQLAVMTFASPQREDHKLILSVWDIAEETLVREWGEDVIGDFVEVHFHPDGKRLLVPTCGCNYDAEIRWFDLESGDVDTVIEGAFSGAALSPDGTWIATAGSDGTAKLWNADTGELVRSFRGHRDIVNFVSFSPDGTMLATTGSDNTTRLWSADSAGDPSGVELALLAGQGGLQMYPRFSGDGSVLATISSNYTVRLWDATVARGEVAGHDLGFARILGIEQAGSLTAVSGRPCAFGGCPGEVVTLDIPSGVLDRYSDATGYNAGLSADGRLLFMQVPPNEPDPDNPTIWGPVRAVDLATGEVQYEFEELCANSTVWEPTCGKPPVTPYDEQAIRWAYSADGSLVALAGNSQSVSLWDPATGELLIAMPGHWMGPDGWLDTTSVALSVDGALLAMTIFPYATIVLETATLLANRSALEELELELREVAGLDIDDEERDQLAAEISSQFGSLLGIAQRFRPIETWRAQFTPDSTRLALASPEGARIYDLVSGETLHVLSPAFDLDLSADGTRMLTMSPDGFVRLWDVESGRELQVIASVSHGLGVHEGAVSFAEDERFVYTVDAGILLVLTVDVDVLFDLAGQRLIRAMTTEECQKYLLSDTCPEPTGRVSAEPMPVGFGSSGGQRAASNRAGRQPREPRGRAR